MATPGAPEGGDVDVSVIGDCEVGLGVKLGKAVRVIDAVGLATAGVAEALVTPMITGVPVKIDGVWVKGRNGVGALLGRGCMTQPLQDARRNVDKRIAGKIFFMFSPLP
jgi:hypothetical protein